MNGTPDFADRIDGLANALRGQGYLTESTWHSALHAVPRHLFVPDVAWALPDFDGKDPYPVDRNRDEQEWLDAVYSDTSLVTQIDDGATNVSTGMGLFTSSASAPGVVCRFLELLDIRDEQRILEIGTGTGWTAALLSHRVGGRNVVTIEIDSEVSAQATRNLESAGWSAIAIMADGANGAVAWAPFDRVHVTCGIARVPYTWIEQTREAGVIVAPYSPGFGYGHKLRLDVIGDGTAVGRFHGAAGYMMMRSHRAKEGQLSSFLHHKSDADYTATRMDPREVIEAGPGGNLAISAMAPGVRGQICYADDDSGEATLWLLETTSDAHVNGSWAQVEYVPGQAEYEVKQYGARRLWDEVRDAYLKWASWGRPDRERFGMVITPERQGIWLDNTARVITASSA